MSTTVLALGMALISIFCGASGGDGLSWNAMLDAAKANELLAPYREQTVSQAREAAGQSIIRRAKTLAEVGKNRTWLDGRANALEDEIRETFALAMSDFAACRALADELPLLAAAFRLTGEPVFRDRVIEQLMEMASWSPLQRPGWTLYHPGARLPDGGKDGNWLATGVGIRAIVDTLEILPPDAVDTALRARLDALLEGEIAGVMDDWKTKRPWFVSGNNAITNQWVLPTEGLVRACLLLGVDAHRDAYDLGVKNLLQALDTHGAAGEFEEGFGYASFTVTSLVHTARAMAVHGDRRAIEHPFLKNFPTWFVHHLQPGGMVINCFDAGGVHGAAEGMRPLLSLFAVCTGSPAARWALAKQVGGPADTIAGLATRTLPPVDDSAAPPLFAAYDRARRVNWRSSWENDATGVWVRGGHPADQHDHYDRGHVNFILHGQPVFIEAGTPYYHHPQMASLFSSGVGHNVLQLGTLPPPKSGNAGDTFALAGWQQQGVVAPITVEKLDAAGGNVTVEITSGYDGLASWKRNAAWDANRLAVHDLVALQAGRKEVVLFRWHLGTNDEVTIKQESPMNWTAAWPNVRVSIEATTPIVVSQTKLPDNTINSVSDDDKPDAMHTCLVVQSTEPATVFDLSTTAAGS